MPFRPSGSDAGHPRSDNFLWDFTYLCWNLTYMTANAHPTIAVFFEPRRERIQM